MYLNVERYGSWSKKEKNQIEFSTYSTANEVYRANIFQFCFSTSANITPPAKVMTNYLTNIQNLLRARHS